MIRSFSHRGLKALFDGLTARRVATEHVDKLRDILGALDHSGTPEDMDLPGFRLHRLKADKKGHLAVTVSGNWRVTFRFEGRHAVDVDDHDYHSHVRRFKLQV
jgi:proteic killer suppression protein